MIRRAVLSWLILVPLTLLLTASARGGSIEPALERWIERLERGEHPAAIAAWPQGFALADSAPTTRTPLDEAGGVTCLVTLGAEARPDSWAARPDGILVEARLHSFVQVYLPLGGVRRLAALPGVAHVALPPRPLPLTLSQGLDSMRVAEFCSLGGFGRGVRVGIIDTGFTGYESLLGEELPAHVTVRSFYRNSLGQLDIHGTDVHGTACAEIVHDVAPEAELYLANVAYLGDLQQATQWMIDSGVEVISHSLAWFAGPGDGTGPVAEVTAMASNAGILWVTAAGNFATSHWSGLLRDADGDGLIEVNEDGRETLAIDHIGTAYPFTAYLMWDRWPTTPDLNLQVDLLSSAGERLASSEDIVDQADSDLAVRYLDCSSCANVNGARMVIRLVSETLDEATLAATRLRVYRYDGMLSEADIVGSGSLASPADVPEVLTVGAFAWSGELDSYSSYGPNIAGVAKPEILGPDQVTTRSYRVFNGTSAACPHLAGAVALLLGSAPQGGFVDGRWSRGEILRLLRETARPATGPTAATGWGKVRLPLAAPSLSAASPSVLLPVSGAGRLHLRLPAAPAAAGDVTVFDVQGRRLGRLSPSRSPNGDLEYDPGELFRRSGARGRFWAWEPFTGAKTSFVWMGGSADGAR